MNGTVEYHHRGHIVDVGTARISAGIFVAEFRIAKPGHETLHRQRLAESFPEETLAHNAALINGKEYVDLMLGWARDVSKVTTGDFLSFVLWHRTGTWPAKVSRTALDVLAKGHAADLIDIFNDHYERIVYVARRQALTNPDLEVIVLGTLDFE